jgi:hypothetical protein
MSETDEGNDVVLRAINEPGFPGRLLSSPKDAITEVTGVGFPDDMELIVLQHTKKTMHVVLPDSRLTLQELHESGGSSTWSLQDSISVMNPDMSFRCSGGFY